MKTIISDIPSRTAFFKREGILEIGYPWLTFGSIFTLEALVGPRIKVLEFGSGGSTLFWAKRCLSVNSFETDRKWHREVRRKTWRLTNVYLTLANETQILKAVKADPDDHYHLVLVNCQPRRDRRLLFANAAVPKLKPKGWLVVNNYSRFSMNAFDYSKWKVYTFDQIGFKGSGTKLCQKI